MTAIDSERRPSRSTIRNPRSWPSSALRLLAALALALSCVPVGVGLTGTDGDAVAREATAPARYPSLTDYLSQAQDASLVGESDASGALKAPVRAPLAASRPLPSGEHPPTAALSPEAPIEDAAGDGAANAGSAAASTLAPESTGGSEDPEAAGQGSGASAEPAAGEDPDENASPDEAASPDEDDPSPEGESPDGQAPEDEGAEEPLGFLGNVLELFGAAPPAEEDSTEDDYAGTGHDLYLKYLLADSRRVSEGDTIDSIFTSEDKILETVIAQYSSTADLLDPGPQSDYYLALMDTTRFLGNTCALDAEFARTNNLGQIVHGPIFDRDTGIAYVPKSLYARDSTMSIVAQVLLSYDLESNPDVLVDVHVDNGNSSVNAVEAQSIRANALDATTTLPVASPATARNITLADLTVYVNGSVRPYRLEEGRNAAYDRDTGELTIFYSPMNLFSVEVDIAGRGLMDNAVRATANEAVAVSDPDALATFPGVCFENLDLDALAAGDWFRYESATNYVWDNPAPGDFSADVRDFCVPYCYGYANDPESLYDILQRTSATWDELGSVGLVASSGYFNCVIGTPDGTISGQDWSTNTWPSTCEWSQNAGGWWSHIALECGHVRNPIGTVPTTAPYFAPIGMRILRVNTQAAEPYIVVGFLGSMVATQSGSGIYKFRVKSAPKYGGLKIEKRDSDRRALVPQGDASLDPTKFQISYIGEGSVAVGGTEYPTGSVVMELETSGGCAQTAADALQEGQYSIREIGTGPGYLLTDNAPRSFTVTADQIVSFEGNDSFFNRVVRGGVSVEKRDAESGLATPQGDASLDGTVFEIVNQSRQPVEVGGATYRPGEVCARITASGGVASTGADALPYGTYGIREAKAGEGYLLSDSGTRTFQIRSAGQMERFIADDGFFDQVVRGGLAVEKRDMESRLLTPLGGASLDGTVFEVTNQSARSVLVEGTWVNPGEVCLRLSAQGGRAETAPDALPYGTYTVREALPGEGYLHSDTEPRTFTIRAQGQMQRYVEEGGFFDQVKRGDLSLVKVRETDMARLTGVPFRLTSQTTGESHILVTDANGHLDTAADWVAHSRDTNGSDNAVDAEGAVDPEALKADSGIWFGLTTEGWTVDADDKLGALPYDAYTLEELRCPANEGLALVVIKDITVQRDAVRIDLGTIDDKGDGSMPSVFTFASDGADLDRIVTAGRDAVVLDRVSYANLVPGETYGLRAVLMDPATGEAVAGSQVEAEFTAEEATGTVTVEIPADTTGLGGGKAVVFEELLYAGGVIAEHKDLEDSGQTVLVAAPVLKTFAWAGIDRLRTLTVQDESADGIGPVVDRVQYTGLTPGAAYRLEAEIVAKSIDEDTGEASVEHLRHESGDAVTAALEFSPESPNGVVDVPIEVDGEVLRGVAELVVFETLMEGDRVVASHQSADDSDQTLAVTEIYEPLSVPDPTVSTYAFDGSDGDKELTAGQQAEVVDSVTYTGLEPEKEYLLSGFLMDKGSGNPFLVDGNMVTAELRFTAVEPDGAVDLRFVFDGSTVAAGAELVVFEQLFLDDELVAEHADLEDAGQTVTVNMPIAEEEEGGPFAEAGDALLGLAAPVAALGIASAAVVAVCGALGWRRSRLEDEAYRRLRR